MSKSGGVRRGVISAHNAVINMGDSHKHMHTHTVSLGVAIGPFPADIALSSVNNTDDNNMLPPTEFSYCEVASTAVLTHSPSLELSVSHLDVHFLNS